ncbi:hypothetical protein ATCC90586_003700 [Pythium insidiosum]|nr:hypothetical protein ATCC90586_003700 [Pythium insidiosum]
MARNTRRPIATDDAYGYLDTKHIPLKHVNANTLLTKAKLSAKKIGPIKIEHVVNDNVAKLKQPSSIQRLNPTFNVELLAPYIENPEKFRHRPIPNHKLWKQLSCALRRRATQLDTVFSDATDGLNHDRNLASISPARLLVPSRCWHWIQRLLGHDRQRTDDAAMDRLVRQRHCGCGYYVPCFWASPSSASASAVTSIEFYVAASCFLSTISVVPYQAFWAPGAPCFAPRRIAVSFHRRDDKQCDCEYYRSPEYVVTNEMTLQRIALPKLVWVTPQCRVQLHLIDRHTAVPSDVSLPKVFQPTASGAPSSCGTAHFFCCLSFVGASGLVPVTTPTRCPARRWWQPSY